MKVILLQLSLLATDVAIAQMYNNGSLSKGKTSSGGVAAPAGYTWSTN